MGMLGTLHNLNLGIAVPQLEALFHKLGYVEEPVGRKRLRFGRPLHTKQLATPADLVSSNTLKRSLFGLVHCYDGLPQSLVDASSVTAFQRRLQFGLLQHAESGISDWQFLYSTGWKLLPRTRRDTLFLV